jgi:protein involved in polysaccharide export with SLBB domain
MKSATKRRRGSPVTSPVAAIGVAILASAQLYASGAQKPDMRANTVTAGGSVADTGAQKPAGPALQERTFRYHLNQGDTFDVTFPVTPEFNQTVTIQPDGYVALTGIGNLQAAGKTVPELTELLRTSYSKILHDPIVNIVVKDFEKPYFIASGELSHPGKYELRSDTTLTEAVAIDARLFGQHHPAGAGRGVPRGD